MSKTPPSVLLSALDNYGGYPFNELFDVTYPTYAPDEIEKAVAITPRCVLIIWGGADISPSIYHQVPNQHTDAGAQLSARDTLEVALAEKAMELDIPIIGICRGAQLMCALSGGHLVQHVEGHAGGYHTIQTDEGTTYNCPSLHHQMMWPWSLRGAGGTEFKLIAWCKGRSRVYFGEPQEEDPNLAPTRLNPPGHVEPEIIYIPATKALCIQSHPEFIHSLDHPFVQYCLTLTQKYILPVVKEEKPVDGDASPANTDSRG